MIYFAQSVEGGPVKIGHSDDVPTRLRQLEGHYGQPLELLATLPGGRDEEQAVHARFAHLRFGRTEQFRPAADLMDFIGRPLLVGANPDVVEAMEPAKVSMRINEDVYNLARQACSFTKESIVEYVSRIVKEHAEADVQAAAERIYRESRKRGKGGVD